MDTYRNIIGLLRQWETHCFRCNQCLEFDKNGPDKTKEPCGIGRAILFNLHRVLTEGGI